MTVGPRYGTIYSGNCFDNPKIAGIHLVGHPASKTQGGGQKAWVIE